MSAPGNESRVAIRLRLTNVLAAALAGELCQRLGEENRTLRASQEQLMAERANLLAKNEQARSRVEAMIHRLRSLEQNG